MIPWSAAPSGWLDEFYKEHGYIPALKPGEKETVADVSPWEKRQPVAVTLGTAYDEWCLSQIAAELGKKEDAEYFLARSYNYRNLFNPETRFFHPKDKDGKFIEGVDYRYSGGLGARDYYDENNGYIYRWDVQHNIGDLVSLIGGNEVFTAALDSMFDTPLGMSKWQFYSFCLIIPAMSECSRWQMNRACISRICIIMPDNPGRRRNASVSCLTNGSVTT